MRAIAIINLKALRTLRVDSELSCNLAVKCLKREVLSCVINKKDIGVAAYAIQKVVVLGHVAIASVQCYDISQLQVVQNTHKE